MPRQNFTSLLTAIAQWSLTGMDTVYPGLSEIKLDQC